MGRSFKGSSGSKFTGYIKEKGIELREFKSDQFVPKTIKSEYPFNGLLSSERR